MLLVHIYEDTEQPSVQKRLLLTKPVPKITIERPNYTSIGRIGGEKYWNSHVIDVHDQFKALRDSNGVIIWVYLFKWVVRSML